MTRKEVRQHKGHMVTVAYRTRLGTMNWLTGLIESEGVSTLLLRIKGTQQEIPIRYETIFNILKAKKHDTNKTN